MIRDNIKKLRHAADVLEEAVTMVKRLRRAADALEALQSDNPFAEPTIAREIEARVEENLKASERRTAKGFKYPKGTHWTQQPENRARVAELARIRGRLGAKTPAAPPAEVITPDVRKRKYAPGQHWTQKPEHRATLEKLLRKAVRTRKQKARQKES